MPPTLFRLSLLLAASLAACPVMLRADDAADIAEAASVAQSWLGEIDSGDYDQCYADAGPALHDKVTQDTWVKILKGERPQMGRVLSREKISSQRYADGLEGVAGDFVVIGYRTSFESRSDELEYVVVKREFGGWRGVGYDFGPEQVSTDPDAGPTTTTETSTNAPPTPTTGITVPAKRGN